MNDVILQLIVYLREYGMWFLIPAIVLQCNGIPTGASLMVMAGGAFSFAGEMNLVTLGITSLGANVLGDISCYFLWKYLGGWILQKSPALVGRLEKGLQKAGDSLERYAFLTIAFSRFPASTFAFPVNIFSGSTGYNISSFAAAVAAGELLWTIFYVGVGYWFGDSWEEASNLISQFSEWILVLVVFIIVCYLMVRQIRKKDSFEDEV